MMDKSAVEKWVVDSGQCSASDARSTNSTTHHSPPTHHYKSWWKEALSNADNVSTTRIILLVVTAYALIMPVVALMIGKFSVELAWYLLGLFTAACGLKGGQKIYEVKREFNQNSNYGSGGTGTYSRYNVAKGRNQRS